MRTHTNDDGSFVDQKAKVVADAYQKNLQEVLDQQPGDGPDSSPNSSEQSTQRKLTIDEQNEIFLKVTILPTLCVSLYYYFIQCYNMIL